MAYSNITAYSVESANGSSAYPRQRRFAGAFFWPRGPDGVSPGAYIRLLSVRMVMGTCNKRFDGGSPECQSGFSSHDGAWRSRGTPPGTGGVVRNRHLVRAVW